jgi:hypothetical protein
MTQSIKNLTAAILIAISSFLVWTEIVPAYGFTGLLKSTIVEKQELLNLKSEVATGIERLNKERGARYAELQRFSLVAPETVSLPELISTIESIFSKSGHLLSEFTIGKSNEADLKNGGFGIINVETSSKGTYAGFLQVLDYLEKNIRLFDVKEVSVGEDLSGVANQLGLTIRGDVYWIRAIKTSTTGGRQEVDGGE